MPVDFNSIRSTIENHISTNWTFTPISFPFTEFDTNAPENALFIAPTINLQTNTKITLTNGFTRIEGILNCMVSSQDKKSGLGNLMTHAQNFVNIFNDKTIGTIRFLPGIIQPADETENRVFITCQIDFYTDQPGG